MLDVDGVLVNGRPEDGRSWDFRLCEDLGIVPEVLGREFFAREWKDVVVGKKDLMRALSASLERIPTSVKAEDLATYWFRMDSRVADTVLSDCRAAREQGIPIYLTTNQEHERADYLMGPMGLNSVVNGIAYSAEAGCKKPEAEFYSHAEGITGLQPHELLLVDDTQANIEGAHKAGWRAVLWDGREKLSEILHRNIRL